MGKDYATPGTRRHGVIRRLRRQGVLFNDEGSQVEAPCDAIPELLARLRELRRKYRFNVQFYFS